MSRDGLEWDASKDLINRRKHGVSFVEVQSAFADPGRVIAADLSRSRLEDRYYCFGKVGNGIMTVRFTYRGGVIRIIGAGYWRRGKQVYERENKIQ